MEKHVVIYPAKISWCDRVPSSVQEEDEGIVILILLNEAECSNALSRMERDMRATTQFLEGTIEDCNGDSLYFGMTSDVDCGYVSYQPKHLKYNEKGHFNRCPTKWSVSESAINPTRRFGQPQDSTWIAFYQWKGSYPNDLSTDYCVSLNLVKRAICEYLATDSFWKGITWAEYGEVPIEEVLTIGRPVLLISRSY